MRLIYPGELESFDRRELSQAELRNLATELSEKYDPRSMTQEDYDSFLDDLVKERLLSEHELGTLEYHGFVVVGSLADGLQGGGSWWIDPKNPDWSTYFSRYGYVSALRDVGGDVLAYTKMMSSWQDPIGSTAFVTWAETRQNAYAIMADVLGAMDQCR